MASYYAVPLRSQELYHYGIIGMKWGVRRYQNPDGSLTAAGRERYGVNGRRKVKKDIRVTGMKGRMADVLGADYETDNGDWLDVTYHGYRKKMGGPRTGKSYDQIDEVMVNDINPKFLDGVEYQTNCMSATTAYLLNSEFNNDGIDTISAAPYYGVDETSGMVAPGGRGMGLSTSLYDSMFDGIDRIPNNDSRFGEMKSFMESSSVPNGSTGVVLLENTLGGGHVVNYEKDMFGDVTIIDAQIGSVMNGDSYTRPYQNYAVNSVLDFSDATIKNDRYADEAFGALVRKHY